MVSGLKACTKSPHWTPRNWPVLPLVATTTAQAADKPADTKPAKAPEKPKTEGAKDAPKRDTYPFGGKIDKVDAAAKSFSIAGKEKSRTFLTTDATKYTKAGQPAKFADLKDGEEVGGLVKKNKDGKEEVVSMRIGAKPAEAKSEPKKADDKKKTDDKK